MPRAPLYKEVKDKLVAALSVGEWRAGDKVPVESELAQRYGVTQQTICDLLRRRTWHHV